MCPVSSLFSDDQPPPKRSRVEADSDNTPSNPHVTLSSSAAQSEHGHFTDVRHSGSSVKGDRIGVVVEDEQKEDAIMEMSSINRISHGSVSLIGRRRVMEDAITVAPPGLPSQHVFLAVFDGQGGPWVSVACHERLHLILADEISREGAEIGVDWSRVMKDSFKKMDDVVKGFVTGNDHGLVADGLDGGDGAVGYETTGSTATVVMVGEEEIVVANCGDSRAVLFSAGVARPLSIDHKPYVPSERMRLQNRGIDIHLDLPVSRSIGHHNHVLKQYLIADPDVNVQQRTKSDEFLILASHGLWDVVSNEDACVVVKNCLDGQIKRSFEEAIPATSPTVAATTLAEFAMARGSKHNISLVVVEL